MCASTCWLRALHRFRRSLPEVLKERVMDPIGATATGNGMATAMPLSSSTANPCLAFPAAGIGAAAS